MVLLCYIPVYGTHGQQIRSTSCLPFQSFNTDSPLNRPRCILFLWNPSSLRSSNTLQPAGQPAVWSFRCNIETLGTSRKWLTISSRGVLPRSRFQKTRSRNSHAHIPMVLHVLPPHASSFRPISKPTPLDESILISQQSHRVEFKLHMSRAIMFRVVFT